MSPLSCDTTIVAVRARRLSRELRYEKKQNKETNNCKQTIRKKTKNKKQKNKKQKKRNKINNNVNHTISTTTTFFTIHHIRNNGGWGTLTAGTGTGARSAPASTTRARSRAVMPADAVPRAETDTAGLHELAVAGIEREVADQVRGRLNDGREIDVTLEDPKDRPDATTERQLGTRRHFALAVRAMRAPGPRRRDGHRVGARSGLRVRPGGRGRRRGNAGLTVREAILGSEVAQRITREFLNGQVVAVVVERAEEYRKHPAAQRSAVGGWVLGQGHTEPRAGKLNVGVLGLHVHRAQSHTDNVQLDQQVTGAIG
jgi:hypothetical protein